MLPSFRPRVGAVVRFAVPLLLVVLAGCGKSTGHISGTVLYKGNPLPGGRLTFLPRDTRQNPVPVVIDAEGHYEATLPVGEVVILVDNRELKPVSQGPPPRLPEGMQIPGKVAEIKPPAEPKTAVGKLPGKYVPIPEMYYLAETSDLKHTVKGGEETYNIEMK